MCPRKGSLMKKKYYSDYCFANCGKIIFQIILYRFRYRSDEENLSSDLLFL